MIYIIQEAFKGFAKNKSMGFITIGIITISLFIFGLFISGTANLMNAIKLAEDKIEMVAYLNDGLSQGDINTIEQQIATIAGVSDVEFVSKEKALEQFRKDLGNDEELLNVFEINPLPASFKVHISMAYKTPEYLAEISQKIGLFSGIEDVDYGAEWVADLDRIVKILFIIDILLGIVLALASVFIVFNTIRLTVHARKTQIDIMDLVGATERYIEFPYIIEGIFHGLIGSGIATLFLYLIFSFIHTRFPDVVFMSNILIYLIIAFGVLLGFIGSYMSVKQCLSEIRETKSRLLPNKQ